MIDYVTRIQIFVSRLLKYCFHKAKYLFQDSSCSQFFPENFPGCILGKLLHKDNSTGQLLVSRQSLCHKFLDIFFCHLMTRFLHDKGLWRFTKSLIRHSNNTPLKHPLANTSSNSVGETCSPFTLIM